MISPQWMQVIWLLVTVAGIVVGGALLVKLFRYEVSRLIARLAKSRTIDPAHRQWIDEISRGMRVTISLLGFLLILLLAARYYGFRPLAAFRLDGALDWLFTRGIRVIFICAGAYLAVKAAHFLVTQVSQLVRADEDTPAAEMERQKRAQTITGILKNLSSVLIIVTAGLMVLSEVGVNIAPILTSLGVVGVALGFGAQQLVGDLIAGFFLILENQIRVGDAATINGASGLVQEIRLRTTILRGFDGVVHVFRNGTISTLSNMTKDYSYFAMDLGVSYSSDIDRISQLVREVTEELRRDAQFGPSILEPVEILGVDAFAESSVTLKFRLKTLPIKQWEVGREFRRRLKQRLDREGIELPYAQRVAIVAFPPTAPPAAGSGAGKQQ